MELKFKNMKHELDDLKGERNYKGCLVRRIIGGFDIWGIKCSTALEVDEAIEKAGTILSESITVKAANGSFTSQTGTDGSMV